MRTAFHESLLAKRFQFPQKVLYGEKTKFKIINDDDESFGAAN